MEEPMLETVAAATPFSPAANLKDLVAQYERRLILEALEAARGNQRQAARTLGVLPTTLNEKMKRLGLRPRDEFEAV
jgi:DNA-binding NtrC family response regulator